MTQTPKSVTHHYDTHDRRIACGVAGPDDHSSKHERSVTCPSCLERLAGHPASGDAQAAST